MKAAASALIDLYLATTELDLQPLDRTIPLQGNYQIHLGFGAEDTVLVFEPLSNQRYQGLSAGPLYSVVKDFYRMME